MAIVLAAPCPVKAGYFSSPDDSHSVAALILMSGLLQKFSLNSGNSQYISPASETGFTHPITIISEYPVLPDPNNGVFVLSVKPAWNGLISTKIVLSEQHDTIRQLIRHNSKTPHTWFARLAEILSLPEKVVPECYRRQFTYMMGKGKLKETQEDEILDEILKNLVQGILDAVTEAEVREMLEGMVTAEVEKVGERWFFPSLNVGIGQRSIYGEDGEPTEGYKNCMAFFQDCPMIINFEDKSVVLVKPVPGIDIDMIKLLMCKCKGSKKCLACSNIESKVKQAMKDQNHKPPKRRDDKDDDFSGFERLTVN